MPDARDVADALRLADQVWGATAPPATPAPAPGARGWFVVQSTPRGEEDAVESLRAIGCDTFLPVMMKEVIHRRSRKVRIVTLILFNRYLFAELPLALDAWRTIAACKGVQQVLGAGGPAPIPAEAVQRFRAAQAAKLFDETNEARRRRGELLSKREATARLFPPGSMIRATSGPFGGFSGLVTNVTGRGAIEAMIEIFGRATPVEFAPDTVEGA